MFISYKHKFVFLHMPKIATTTSRLVLAKSGLLGPDGVFSGVNYEEGGPNSYPQQGLAHITPYQYANSIMERPIRAVQPSGRIVNEQDPWMVEMLKTMTLEEVDTIIMRRLLAFLTPEEIVNAGLLTPEQREEFKFYCVIRDPIQRYLSAFFHTQAGFGVEPKIEDMEREIEEADVDYGIVRFMNRKYENVCTHGVDVLLYENFNDDIVKIIKGYGGDIELPLPREKGNYRPDWSREPVSKWMPESTLNKLNLILAKDIEFYNERR